MTYPGFAKGDGQWEAQSTSLQVIGAGVEPPPGYRGTAPDRG